MKRKYNQDFQVDGAPILDPDVNVGVDYQDIMSKDSGEDESGVLHRFVTRHNVRRWTFEYAVLTIEEFKYMREMIRGKTDFSFTFVNEIGEKETVTAYCPGCNGFFYSKRSGLYRDFKFEIIEC